MYKQVTILNSESDRALRYTVPENLEFARKANAFPIAYTEIPNLCCDYPIIFVDAEDPYLAVLVGFEEEGNNLALDEAGKWRGAYVPAFLRRYPFSLAAMSEDRFALAIDLESGCFSSPEGEALYTAEGEPSKLLKKIQSFAVQFHTELQKTQAWVKTLKEKGLLVPRTLTIGEGESQKQLAGFFLLDNEKLHNLDDALIADWTRKGWLDLLALQNFSLRNVQKLAAFAQRD